MCSGRFDSLIEENMMLIEKVFFTDQKKQVPLAVQFSGKNYIHPT